MARLDAEFGGELPGDFDVLVSLPGIGRKTANLLVATVFGQPGLVVDTHFIRLSNRLGFVKNEPDADEDRARAAADRAAQGLDGLVARDGVPRAAVLLRAQARIAPDARCARLCPSAETGGVPPKAK